MGSPSCHKRYHMRLLVAGGQGISFEKEQIFFIDKNKYTFELC